MMELSVTGFAVVPNSVIISMFILNWKNSSRKCGADVLLSYIVTCILLGIHGLQHSLVQT